MHSAMPVPYYNFSDKNITHMVKALFSPCSVRVQKGSSEKNLKKSKNFFENPEHFRKKNDYIGEGTFAPPYTARGGGGCGRFFSKSGNGFPFLVNALDIACLGMVK